MQVQRNARRQFDKNLMLFWRDGGDGTPREGLVVATRGCTSRECKCREVTVNCYRVGEALAEVSETSEGPLALSFAPGADTSAPCVLTGSVDIDTGLVAHDPGASPMVHDEAAIAWLQGEIDGAVLSELDRRFIAAKGWRADPDAWRKSDWSNWAPGNMVGWREITSENRQDFYVVDGRTFLADDHHCVMPTCACRDVRVAFCEVKGKTAVQCASVLVQPPATEPASVVPDDDTPEWRDRTRRLWEAFRRRHGMATLERRMARMKLVGPELIRIFRARTIAAVQQTTAKPGRNDPCHCGSGKKYKKCCLAKDERPGQ